MKMKIAIRDRRYRTGTYKTWKVIHEIDAKTVDASIPLTNRAIKHWEEDKSTIGYATMRGLSLADIKSIISATRRNEAHMNIERWGRVAYYKLHNKPK